MKTISIAVLASLASTLSGEPHTDHETEKLRDGHVDLLVLHEATEGLHLAIAAGEHDPDHGGGDHDDDHDDDHDHDHRELDHVEVVGGPKAAEVAPGGTSWDFLGGSDRFFFVLPQAQVEGLPFLGLNTEELVGAEFATAPTLELMSVEGPGNFFLYSVDSFNNPVVEMDSSDSDPDRLTLPLNTHLHLNWAFSEPGEYALTFELRATLSDETAVTSDPQVVHFHIVGQPEYLHDGHADIGLHNEAGHGLEFYIAAEDDDDHGHDHGHEDDHDHGHEDEHSAERHPGDVIFLLGGYAASEVPDNSAFGFLGQPGETFYLIGQQSREGVPFAGWSTEDLEPMDFQGDIQIELHDVEGPGNVFLYEVDEFGGVTVLWDSADAMEDLFTLPVGIHRHLNLALTQPGTYELKVHAEAVLAGGDEVHTETVLTLQAGGMEGYYGHFHRPTPLWMHAETGGWLDASEWPWIWSPSEGWLYASGNGGPEHYYFRAHDGTWLSTSPEEFPSYRVIGASDWSEWGE